MKLQYLILAYFTYSVFLVTRRDNYIKCLASRTQADCCMMGSQSAVLAAYTFLNLNVYDSKHRFIRNHQSQFMQRTDSSFMMEPACSSVTQLGIAEEQVGDKLGSLILEVTGNIPAEICSKSQTIKKRIGGTKYLHLRSAVL